MGILSAIGKIFGMLMYFIYNTIGLHNYALSLVFFTLVYKLILLPLSIKQMKSTKLMESFSRNYKEFRNAINMTKKSSRKNK